MREKQDSLFKSNILNKTSHLTREQFGILITIAMIEDDKLTEKRYEDIDDIFLESYIKKEEEWKNEFDKIINDPILMNAYNIIFGSAKKSRKGYNELKEKLEKQDNKKETKEDKEFIEQQNKEYDKMKLKTNYFINKRTYTATYKAEYENNVPTENDLADLEYSIDKETLIKLIEIGNKEEWKRHYEEILNELQIEEQLKEESPFDCIERTNLTK